MSWLGPPHRLRGGLSSAWLQRGPSPPVTPFPQAKLDSYKNALSEEEIRVEEKSKNFNFIKRLIEDTPVEEI